MFEYRRNRKALLRRIAEAGKEMQAQALTLKDQRPQEVSLFGMNVAQYKTRKCDLEMELEVLKARHLLDKAKRWGIEGSAPQELYDPNYVGLEPRPYFKPNIKSRCGR